MSFLLDTDICSAYLKGDRRLANRFLQYSGQLNISVITLGELFAWALRRKSPKKRIQGVLKLLSDVSLHNVTHDIARVFGEVRADLLDRGLPAPKLDLFIAATALAHNFTLVTHNVADYQNVPNLRVVDWLVP